MNGQCNSPLNLLSVVIPARDEEGCIASTLEHLHLELQMNSVPHEIIVVDDGSTDKTIRILKDECQKFSELQGRKVGFSLKIAEIFSYSLLKLALCIAKLWPCCFCYSETKEKLMRDSRNN